MKNIIIYVLLILICVSLMTCRKKLSLKVRLINPALNEYVANATVVLVQKKETGGIFSANSSCQEVAEATTDANGTAIFNEVKLKGGNKEYFCAVKKSWGLNQSYSCAGRTSGFITFGQSTEQTIIDEADGYFKIQYNNLLNPSQPGDSLIVSLNSIDYYNPDGSIVYGNGGVFGNLNFNDVGSYPYPAILTSSSTKTKGQRLKRTIKKRKMGIVTTSIDTVKVYPNQTTTIVVNW